MKMSKESSREQVRMGKMRKVDCVFLGLRRKPLCKRLEAKDNVVRLRYKGTAYAFFAPESGDDRSYAYLINNPAPIGDDGHPVSMSSEDMHRMLDSSMLAALAATESFKHPVIALYLPDLRWREAFHWVKRAIASR